MYKYLFLCTCHTARGNDIIWQAITSSSIHTCERGCYCPRNMMFTELSLGFWSSRHKNLSACQILSSTVVFLVSYMHVRAPFIMYCSTFFVVFLFLNMTFVGSQSFISLPSFMFVSAAVSELCESNQNKEEEEKKKSAISNLTSFLSI